MSQAKLERVSFPLRTPDNNAAAAAAAADWRQGFAVQLGVRVAELQVTEAYVTKTIFDRGLSQKYKGRLLYILFLFTKSVKSTSAAYICTLMTYWCAQDSFWELFSFVVRAISQQDDTKPLADAVVITPLLISTTSHSAASISSAVSAYASSTI
jgi:hypothetical protein